MSLAFTEALILGLVSGPVCLASCGPVLLPCLVARPDHWHGHARSLAVFLSGRLFGYFAFALAIWALGLALPLDPAPRALLFGLANLALALAILVYAWFPRRTTAVAAPLVHIAAPPVPRRSATFSVGLVTGLNLCPPFAAVALRAVQSGSLPSSLLFFLTFFIGTAIWFLPTLGVSTLRNVPAAPSVARYTLTALSIYYGYYAAVTLYWRFSYA